MGFREDQLREERDQLLALSQQLADGGAVVEDEEPEEVDPYEGFARTTDSVTGDESVVYMEDEGIFQRAEVPVVRMNGEYVSDTDHRGIPLTTEQKWSQLWRSLDKGGDA